MPDYNYDNFKYKNVPEDFLFFTTLFLLKLKQAILIQNEKP